MVRGHHLQLRSHPPLFHNFRQFDIKAVTSHHSVIQKVKDQLLAKSAIEQLPGGVGLYSNVLLFLSILVVNVPYWIISNLIGICTYLLLRCLLTDRYGILLNKVIMLSVLMLSILICIFLLQSIIIVITFCSAK